MVFKMTITNIRHDEFGKQEERIVLENANPVSNGSELLQLLQAAAQKGFKKPIPKAPEVPEAVQINVPSLKMDPLKNAIADLKDSLSKTSNEPAKKQAQAEGKPKAIDLIGAKTNGFTIAEKIGILKEEEVTPVETAASVPKNRLAPDEMENVQVLIRCLECGYNGTHGTYLSNTYTKCRGCGEKLFLERAAEEWGEADFDGNFYVAQDRFKTKKELWEERNGVQS